MSSSDNMTNFYQNVSFRGQNIEVIIVGTVSAVFIILEKVKSIVDEDGGENKTSRREELGT